jgi:4-azaleucine resistance transporter AzlC
MSTASTLGTPRAEFIAGVKDTLPLVVGAIPFAIIFGAVAVTNGLSPAAAAGMSAFVYAGSAQFIGAQLVGAGAAIPIIVITTFIVNLRHALYSASLGPYMKHLSQRWIIPLGFWLTDETFVVVIRHFERLGQASPWYYLGSSLAMYINWQFCTWIGIFAGKNIPEPRSWGLDFALSVTFIGMTVPMLKNRSNVVSVIVAGVVALLANSLPNKLGLILAALLGVAAGVISKRYFNESPDVPASARESAVEAS